MDTIVLSRAVRLRYTDLFVPFHTNSWGLDVLRGSWAQECFVLPRISWGSLGNSIGFLGRDRGSPRPGTPPVQCTIPIPWWRYSWERVYIVLSHLFKWLSRIRPGPDYVLSSRFKPLLLPKASFPAYNRNILYPLWERERDREKEKERKRERRKERQRENDKEGKRKR